MLPGEDLAGLFQPPDPVEPFRQGVVLTFDTATGTSTVDVGGVVLSNLPFLNIGDTINLAPGDVVVLMRVNGSWAILGRVVTPNSAKFAVASVATEIRTGDGTNFAVPLADAAVATTPAFKVPIWANKVDVLVMGVANARNSNAAAAGFLYGFAQINFTAGIQKSTEQHVSAPANAAPFINQPFIAATHAGSVSGAIGGQTFTADMRVSTDATTGAWAASTANFAHVSAIAVYTKV